MDTSYPRSLLLQFTARASANPGKRELELACTLCDTIICDIEDGDDLSTLAGLAAGHAHRTLRAITAGDAAPALVLAFFNVGLDGMTYDSHATLNEAVAIMRTRPEEIIAIMQVTPACLRYLTEEDYSLETALADGMAFSEYVRVLEEDLRRQQ